MTWTNLKNAGGGALPNATSINPGCTVAILENDMENIETLRQAARTAQSALYEAEAIQRDKDNAALVGKTFKYHNAGGGCDKRWWYYIKVIRTKDGHLRTFAFQDMPNGQIEIETDHFMMAGSLLGGGYVEIPKKEFNAAWKRIAAKIAKLPPNAQ